jgi:hypothetical protein
MISIETFVPMTQWIIKGTNLRPFAIIPIGYPVKENEPKLRYDESKVHWNKY